MKIVFAVLTAVSVLTGCVVPVARPVGYGGPLVYGHAGVGGYGPGLVYNQPIIVAPPRFSPAGPPVYLHVPSEHHRDWRQHCSHYRACDRPVYFVREPGQRPPPGAAGCAGVSGPCIARVARGRIAVTGRRDGTLAKNASDAGRTFSGRRAPGRGERADRVPGHRPLTQGDPRTR